ncbi:21554_t:CDS:1, partial [Gigaspora margarita]
IIDIISKKCTYLKRKKKRKIEENDDKNNYSVVSTLFEKEDIKTEDETRWKITNQKLDI